MNNLRHFRSSKVKSLKELKGAELWLFQSNTRNESLNLQVILETYLILPMKNKIKGEKSFYQKTNILPSLYQTWIISSALRLLTTISFVLLRMMNSKLGQLLSVFCNCITSLTVKILIGRMRNVVSTLPIS